VSADASVKPTTFCVEIHSPFVISNQEGYRRFKPVRGMVKGDFESIVRSHQAMVYSIAYYFFHNVHLAEEIAQSVGPGYRALEFRIAPDFPKSG